ncbi:MAG: hypothetical protein IPG88_24885 [Gemmatimonadetes bacterium]|nr:hypothetical protein [Gemmatimonadota bacterium]
MSTVEKLRKTLLHSAAFVLSAGPTIEGIPEEALEYLSRCRFLQTAVGSYIARVQLPQGAPLLEATLFEEGISSSEVSETLVDALAFVSNRVFADDAALYTEEGFENDAEEINLDVFRDIGELLEKSRAESVNFSLTSAESEDGLDRATHRASVSATRQVHALRKVAVGC